MENLTNEEYNLIQKITTKAKLDWFELATDEYGNDFVIDNEEDETLSLVDGILLLDDCLNELEDYNLSEAEIQLYDKLIHRIRVCDSLDQERLITLLFNSITLIESNSCDSTLKGTKLQSEIGISDDEYDYIMGEI